jgi:hypothetical protein
MKASIPLAFLLFFFFFEGSSSVTLRMLFVASFSAFFGASCYCGLA